MESRGGKKMRWLWWWKENNSNVVVEGKQKCGGGGGGGGKTIEMWWRRWWWRENNGNVVAAVVVVVVEGKQWKCGGGGGGGGGRGKTVEMWWQWWWRRENNRNVVAAVVVVLEEEDNRILWPKNLYKCATFLLILSLHSALEELTWVGSVLPTKNPLAEEIVCKDAWCLNTAMLVSPNSNSSKVFTAMSAVSLRASFHLHDCRNDLVRKNGLGSISIATSFRDNLTSPWEDRLVLFTMAACVYTNASRHATHWIRQGNSYGFGAGFLFWCELTEFDRVWWLDDWRQ